jgi:hypothetical protein
MDLKKIVPPYFEKIEYSELNHQTPAGKYIKRNDLSVLHHKSEYRGLKEDEERYNAPMVVEHENVYDIDVELFNGLFPSGAADCKLAFHTGIKDWNAFFVSDYNLFTSTSIPKDDLLSKLEANQMQPFIGGLNDYDIDGRPYIYILVSTYIEQGDKIIKEPNEIIISKTNNSETTNGQIVCIADDTKHYSYLCLDKIRVNDYHYSYFVSGGIPQMIRDVTADGIVRAKNVYLGFIDILTKFSSLPISSNHEFIALALDLHNYNLSPTTISIDKDLQKKVSRTVHDLNEYLYRYTSGPLTAVDLVKYIIRMNYTTFVPGLMHKKWVKDVLAEKRVYSSFVRRFNTFHVNPVAYKKHIAERVKIYSDIAHLV